MNDLILFEIYQLKDGECSDEFEFMNSEFWKSKNKQIELDDYEKVETNIIDTDGEETTERLLDRIYEAYNINKPEEFKHRSVSVSDIILLYFNEREYYFVDSIGFKKLENANVFDF